MENVKEKIFLDEHDDLVCRMTFDPEAKYPITVEIQFTIDSESGDIDGDFCISAKHENSVVLINGFSSTMDYEDLPAEIVDFVDAKKSEIEQWDDDDFEDYLDVEGLRYDFYESKQSEQMRYLGHNRAVL
jgi:hypothetical protein